MPLGPLTSIIKSKAIIPIKTNYIFESNGLYTQEYAL